MKALTWSPDLYNAVRFMKEQDKSEGRAILSSYRLSTWEKLSIARILIDKVDIAVIKDWY